MPAPKTPPFEPCAGNFCKITVEIAGTPPTEKDIPAINWSLSDMAKSRDVSNFRDGRYRIGTLGDATLTFTMVWDASEPPFLTTSGGLKRGARVTCVLYTDNDCTPDKAYHVPGLVDQCDLKNEGVEGTLLYDCTVLLSGSPTYWGEITYPTE